MSCSIHRFYKIRCLVLLKKMLTLQKRALRGFKGWVICWFHSFIYSDNVFKHVCLHIALVITRLLFAEIQGRCWYLVQMAKFVVSFNKRVRPNTHTVLSLFFNRIGAVLLWSSSWHLFSSIHFCERYQLLCWVGAYEVVWIINAWINSCVIFKTQFSSTNFIKVNVNTTLYYAGVSPHIVRPMLDTISKVRVLSHLVSQWLVYSELWIWMPLFIFLKIKASDNHRIRPDSLRWISQAFDHQLLYFLCTCC